MRGESLAPNIHKLRGKENLTLSETREIFDKIFAGDVSETEISALLLALHRKGETTPEILGAVESLKSKAITIAAPDNAMDIVGTGGDSRGTFNISTAAALVVAACGVPVAKHGNRAATSKSGSSDVLTNLGVNLDAPFDVLEKCLNDIGICFLFAPRHHPAMRHVAEVRKKLGVRTIFNILGPLINPANVKRHLVGVFSAEWLIPMAEVLQASGSTHAWLTHGQDGMDEITTTCKTSVVSMLNDEIATFTIHPDDAGIPLSLPQDLVGGDSSVNARAIIDLLEGKQSAYRDVVTLNAGAALVVAQKAIDLRQGVLIASEHIDNGAASETLRKLVDMTNEQT